MLLRTVLFLVFSIATQAKARGQDCAPATVLVTLDRSSSMAERLEGGGTKWDAAVACVSTVSASLESRLALGLQIFPMPDACSPGAVVVEPALGTSAAIVDALAEPPPNGGSYTPLAETLDAAAVALETYASISTTHVIVITDGWQWCDPYNRSTRFDAVDSVGALTAEGVTVHVVGFGSGVDVLALNRMAVAAGTAVGGCDPDETSHSSDRLCYLQASDAESLLAALEMIATTVAVEECNGEDDDCDGRIDETFDVDGDGAMTCGVAPDCDDDEPDVHPLALEHCDRRDNNCDGRVDEGCDRPEPGAEPVIDSGSATPPPDALTPFVARPSTAGPGCACSVDGRPRPYWPLSSIGFLIGLLLKRLWWRDE